MKNELALSGERICEKVYPDLFENIGMIRGEYLIRELNQSVLNVVTQKKIGQYLEELCQLYADELVWYRFSELTITEANVLQGTRTQLEDQHPLFGLRGLRRLLEFSDEFLAELKVMVSVYQSHHNLCVFLPFVNDAAQLSEAIKFIRGNGFQGDIGCMIELPSAYFDLDNILQTGIKKIVIGMNDLTSFIFGAVREDQWHQMDSLIMSQIISDINDKATMMGVKIVVAGYLSKNLVKTLNGKGIKCVIHYNLIPEIFGREIAHPNHLVDIKKLTKEKIRAHELDLRAPD
ncbi:MAG: putative PEP-binding protein [Lactococcus raffinolactis]